METTVKFIDLCFGWK